MSVYVTLTDPETNQKLYILASACIVIRPERTADGLEYCAIEPNYPTGEPILVKETAVEVVAAVLQAEQEAVVSKLGI